MRELHLFAGIGGGILAGEMLGHAPVGAVEANPFCRRVLRRHWPGLELHDDIRTFQGASWRGRVDLVAGGFPCQDISAAGRGAGLAGARSSLWFEMLRVVREVEPGFVFVENSPMLRSRGLDVVLGGLAELGFDAEWGVLSAADVGANHLRKRMWILGAHPDRAGSPVGAVHDRRAIEEPAPVAAGVRADVAHAGGGLQAPEREELRGAERRFERGAATERGWWGAEPDVGRVSYGVPSRVDRLRALGNAQVPLQAAQAFEILWRRLGCTAS